MKAIIVDDSRAIRAHVRRMLEEIGFECAEATDGKDAMTQLTAGTSFDVALIDYNMPEMTGPELLRALQESSTQPSMKKLMVTSMTDVSCVSEAIESGADDYLMKPFVADALVDKLQMLGIDV